MLDSTSSIFSYDSAAYVKFGPARRLMVLVPAASDYIAASHRIWELANATGANILFVGLYSDVTQEPSLRRELVTMSALVNDGKVSAKVEVLFGRDWVNVVKARWQTGDLVVCFDEQQEGLSHRPLSQILQSDLDVPLHILSGLYPEHDASPTWQAQTAAWIGSIAILLGFFALQVKIGDLAVESARTGLLLVSIPFEFWLIWVWNSMFG